MNFNIMEDKSSILSDLEATEIEGSYLQRVLISVVDWVIEILLLIFIYYILPKELFQDLIINKPYVSYAIIILLMISYRLLCILIFSKTVGMMVCKIKYLNNSLQPLTSPEKLIASIAIRTSKIKYYKSK